MHDDDVKDLPIQAYKFFVPNRSFSGYVTADSPEAAKEILKYVAFMPLREVECADRTRVYEGTHFELLNFKCDRPVQLSQVDLIDVKQREL